MLLLLFFHISFYKNFHIITVYVSMLFIFHSFYFYFYHSLLILFSSDFAIISEAELISYQPFHSFSILIFYFTELLIESSFQLSLKFAIFISLLLTLHLYLCSFDLIHLKLKSYLLTIFLQYFYFRL